MTAAGRFAVASMKPSCSDAEWQARVNLAACYLKLSCETQLAAITCNTKLVPVPQPVLDETCMNYQRGVRQAFGVLDWPAHLRRLNRLNPTFRE